MSEAAEKAWAIHEQAIYRSNAAFGPRHPFIVGYDAGWEAARKSAVPHVIVKRDLMFDPTTVPAGVPVVFV